MRRILAISLLFLIPLAFAAEFPAPTDKYVNDFAHVFSPEDVQQLRILLNQVEKDTTAEIVVVTVNTTSPYVPSEYRTKLFAEWGVGKEDKDNGLLILYAVTEKRIEVETGYGFEGILPDSKVGRILDEYYVPLRDNGDPIAGVVAATNAYAQVAEENAEELQSTVDFSVNYLAFILGAVIVLGLILILVFVSPRGGKEAPNSYGIKADTFFRRVLPGFVFAAAAFYFLFGSVIIGILLFLVAQLVPAIRGPRCIKDGLRMRRKGSDGGYKTYSCPHGHIGGILAVAAAAFFWGAGRGSGFGGGGFGGGFGGGGSGGGGAGR